MSTKASYTKFHEDRGSNMGSAFIYAKMWDVYIFGGAISKSEQINNICTLITRIHGRTDRYNF